MQVLRRVSLFGCCASALVLVFVACEGDKPDQETSSGQVESGEPGDGPGSGAGGASSAEEPLDAQDDGDAEPSGAGTSTEATPPSSGPFISSAPDAWERPAECGGIGNMCPNLSGCAERSICQLLGPVCVPSQEGGLAAGSEERPYCAAWACMTFEEASCFCTGEAGEVTSACSSPGAMAGLCAAEQRDCSEDECCSGLVCVERALGVQACQVPCQVNEDCESGCCTDRYDTGQLICADADACVNQCDKQGEACESGSSTTPDSCCRGDCVQSENPDFAGCRHECRSAQDCESGCCQLYTDSTDGFCVDAAYCTCVGVGEDCAVQASAGCCEGTACFGTEAAGFICAPTCSRDSDCESGPCALYEGREEGVCGSYAAEAAGTCKQLDEACSGGEFCCGGLTCAGFDDGFTCHVACTQDGDCGDGFCSTFEGRSDGICVD